MNKSHLLGIASLLGSIPAIRNPDHVAGKITEATEAMQRGDFDRANALLTGKRQPRDFFIDAIDQPIGSGLQAEVVRDTNQRPKGRGARRREAARKRQEGEAKGA